MTDLLLPALNVTLGPPDLTQDTPLAPAPQPPRLSPEDVEEIRLNVASSDAEATKRAYSGAWAKFTAWCEVRGATPLPCLPETLAAYLSLVRQVNGEVPAAGTLSLYLSAIKRAHRERGLVAPTEHPLVYRTWRGIRRRRGTRQHGKTALRWDLLTQVLDAVEKDRLPPWDAAAVRVRDRALLLVGFAGAFRRSELAGLRVRDVGMPRDPTASLLLTITSSKTSDEAVVVEIPRRSGPYCPVKAVIAWIEVLSDSVLALSPASPLWYGFGRGGKLRPSGLSDAAVSYVVKRAATLVLSKAQVADVSAHSLRAGFATSAAEARIPVSEIKAQGRWKSVTTVDRYVQTRQRGADNPAARIGVDK